MSEKGVDVMIALPSYDGKYFPQMQRSLDGVVQTARQSGLTLSATKPQSSIICNSRILSVLRAQAEGARWIFFVDADMVLPADALVRLLHHNQPVTAGMYFGKHPPFVPIASRLDEKGNYIPLKDWPDDELIPVDGVGAGCLLIRMDVFEKVQKPWFWMPQAPNDAMAVIGEDYCFCREAIRAGFRVLLDTAVQCGHVGMYVFDQTAFTDVRDQAKAEASGAKNGSAIITPAR